MATKLIRLEDGTLIEVEMPVGQVQPISGGSAERITDATLDKIRPILVKTCRPVLAAWKEIEAEDMGIEQAEIVLGLSFETEGNIYVTKSKAAANLTVKLILKPKSLT